MPASIDIKQIIRRGLSLVLELEGIFIKRQNLLKIQEALVLRIKIDLEKATNKLIQFFYKISRYPIYILTTI